MVFVTAGMGGGTGTGACPVVAEIAKETGALTVAVVTMPFTFEGHKRRKAAEDGLEQLRPNVDSLVVVPNDKLLIVAPDLPLNMAFRVSDEVLANATKGIVEMVTKPGMVNLDFADLKMVLRDSGYAVIGSGEGVGTSDGTGRAVVAFENAIKSPMLDVDLSNAKKALVNIIGGESLTMREAETVFQSIASRISGDAMLKWGARIEQDMQKDALRIMIVVSGVDFPEYTESGITGSIKRMEEIDLDEMFEEEKKEKR
jgi:cell division protein FtsZ